MEWNGTGISSEWYLKDNGINLENSVLGLTSDELQLIYFQVSFHINYIYIPTNPSQIKFHFNLRFLPDNYIVND